MNLSSRKNLDIKISEITQLFNLINELNNTKKKKYYCIS